MKSWFVYKGTVYNTSSVRVIKIKSKRLVVFYSFERWKVGFKVLFWIKFIGNSEAKDFLKWINEILPYDGSINLDEVLTKVDKNNDSPTMDR